MMRFKKGQTHPNCRCVLDWYPDHRIKYYTESLAFLRVTNLDEEKYEFGLLTIPKVTESIVILHKLKYPNVTHHMSANAATLLQCVGEDKLTSFYLKFAN